MFDAANGGKNDLQTLQVGENTSEKLFKGAVSIDSTGKHLDDDKIYQKSGNKLLAGQELEMSGLPAYQSNKRDKELKNEFSLPNIKPNAVNGGNVANFNMLENMDEGIN